MKLTPLFLSSALLLAACGGSAQVGDANRLQNPLYAKRYWLELSERLTNLQIQKDPSVKEKAMTDRVEAIKKDAIQKRQEADAEIDKGLSADFLSIGEPTEGTALLKDGMLYLSPHFVTYPGANLHIVLTDMVDPRDKGFPDASLLDVGVLQSPYGMQQYLLPEKNRTHEYRTVVLWDEMLKRITAFAQLSR